MNYIKRHAEDILLKMSEMFKIVLVTGQRQVGKTTIIKKIFGNTHQYVSLDDMLIQEQIKRDPALFFQTHQLPIIIDEVQKVKEIFPYLKLLADQSEKKGQIILTGSQTFSLMHHVSESLAGRVGILSLSGLSLREINTESFQEKFLPDIAYISKKRKSFDDNLWSIIHRGSYPELYENKMMDWQLFYRSYVSTYIERDVREIINIRDLNRFSVFMVAVAARTGQLINYASIASEVGIDLKTAMSWLGVLEASSIVYIAKPYSNNLLSRAVKTPTLYFMDTGLASFLLKWQTPEVLENGAMSGFMLQTYAVSEIIKSYRNKGVEPNLMFYRDRDQNEVDIVLEQNGKLYLVEVKKTAHPSLHMIKNFDTIKNKGGIVIGGQYLLSMIEKPMYLTKEVIAYPISKI